MAIQKTAFTIKGMTRDMAVSKFSPELAFENKNLRIIATEENTSFGLVNERGTADTGVTVQGIPIGQEVINNTLILFTTGGEGGRVMEIDGVTGGTLTLPSLSDTIVLENSSDHPDHIYKFSINSSNQLVGGSIYDGNLGFSAGCPIESIGVYENQEIQKVYWTDGINQPRVINIMEDPSKWNNNYFNFVPVIPPGVSVSITRNENSFGSFAPGVIQYCFTYYNQYGTESNIFYTTPLYYVSHSTRGANPEDTVSCSFTIRIQNYSNKFDFVRIYSILRTSVDATPQVRKVVDVSIRNSTSDIYYTDAGISGESLDPTDLLFVGGEPILADTISQKDNTLFLGNIRLGRQPVSSSLKSACSTLSSGVSESTKVLPLPDNRASVGNYSYTSQLNKSNSDITYYRKGETYRLGIQAQHYTGKWSDVIFIKDHTVSAGISERNDGDMNVPVLYVSLSSSLVSTFVAAGYVKVRPMVVFPDANNRNIICEGVCCPTVYNVEDRHTNSPYTQASWFFRPMPSWEMGSNSPTSNSGANGKIAEFRHNYPIPANNKANAEIQCISNTPQLPVLNISHDTYTEPSSADAWVEENKECFYIDQSIFTFHSPDIEFDNSIKMLGNATSGIQFRIIGYVPIDASYSDIDIQATAPSNYADGVKLEPYVLEPTEYHFLPTVAPGFIKPKVSITDRAFAWHSLLSGAMWFDELPQTFARNSIYPVGFIVYPWHKSGALNNGPQSQTNSILQHKKMSIFRFSKNTTMLGSVKNMSISGVTAFNADTLAMQNIETIKGSGVYYGNIDKLIFSHNKPKGSPFIRDWGTGATFIYQNDDTYSIDNTTGGYPIMVANTNKTRQFLTTPHPIELQWPDTWTNPDTGYADGDNEKENDNVRITDDYSAAFGRSYVYLDGLDEVDTNVWVTKRYIFDNTKTASTEPVSMKYKSTPHLVVSLAKSGTKEVALPTINNLNTVASTYSYNTFYGTSGVVQSSISTTSPGAGFLWLGELYRTNIDDSTRFGGTSDKAIENNRWIPAGEPVDIVTSSGAAAGSKSVYWTQGDTYYQRYDCLKTYPFTLEDINSVSDTLSFMCETRINIDGRYDRNRGQLSNLYASPENINLINNVYSQQNNYFTYKGVNINRVNSTYFPNTITWTKTKINGEEVDKWTNVTLASVLDVDGDKGRLRALRRFNNDLLAFQDRGISQILYNENVQISSASGVPIEIANSGKVSGKRYISNHIGCINKWSICSAPAGIYFMDDIGKDIYLFDGKLNNISDRFGFHSWIISNFPDIKIWNPRDFDLRGEVTYYDKVNGDVMFITNNTCLSFSEPLGNFSSFYSYEKTPYFSSLEDRGILWHKDDSTQSGTYKAWWYREGDYNYFYNVYHPFYVTVVANEHPTEDKIFNNLEYRGDTFDVGSNEGEYLYKNTFNKLVTWNEYQEGVANLEDVKDNPSNLKKKFRIWRANIPRNTENKGGDEYRSYRRDRMRNPWLYIKLSKELTQPETGSELTEREINNKKSILHDLVVYYFQ